MNFLHAQIGEELSELAKACAAVENTISNILSDSAVPMENPVVTLQGLDLMRQSLEDLSRLSCLLASTQTVPDANNIDVDKIHATIILTGLAERLTNFPETANNAHEIDYDVIWG